MSEPSGASRLGKERIRRIARLKERKIREEDGQVLLEGPRLVSEAARVGGLIELFVRDAAAEAFWAEQDLGIPVRVVGESALRQLSEVRTPQSVVGIGHRLQLADPVELLRDAQRILYLDAVQDPGNVGTIARTGAALGIDGLLLGPGTADPESPKVLRSSAGSFYRLRFARDAGAGLQDLVARRSHPWILPVVSGGQDLRDFRPPKAFVLVLGNEGQGSSLDPALATPLSIPLAAGVESLNVSAALAVILGRWL